MIGVMTTNELDEDQMIAASRVMRNTPVIGVKHIDPKTVDDLLENLQYLADQYAKALREREEYQSKVWAHERDITVFRRVLGTFNPNG
jgi:ABC-type phosphate/phosphonate transport system substrate-binding protein